MRTSESLKSIIPDYLKAQEEIHNIAPNKKGYGYDYVDLALIIDRCKPVLLRNGLIIIQSVGEAEQGISITTRLQHVSGEYVEDTFSLPLTTMKGVNNVQAMGASITYGRRYGLSAILGIATDEDVDGVTPDKPVKKQEKPFNPADAEKKIEALMQKAGFTMEYRDHIRGQFKGAKTRADYTAIYKAVELEAEAL